MKISKINFMIPTQLKKLTTKTTVKAAITAVPFVTVPLVAYNLKGDRDSNLTHYCQQAIEKVKELLNDGKITQSEYNSDVNKIKNYYDNAKNLPADVSSSKIKQGEPTFGGNSDYDVYSGNDTDDDCCDSDSDSDDAAGCATSSC